MGGKSMTRIGRLTVAGLLVMVLSGCAISGEGEAFPTALPAAPTLALAPAEMPTAISLENASGGVAGRPSSGDEMAALVNGAPISRVEYEARLAQALTYRAAQGALTGEAQVATAAAPPTAALAEQVLEWLIDRALIAQAAQALGVVVSPEEVEAALASVRGNDAARFTQWLSANGLTEDSFREQLRDDLLMAAVRDRVTAHLPPEAEQVRALHILVGDEALAMRLVTELRGGADFGALARQYSEDEGTRSRGGELGFFPRGVMSPAFDEAAFSLRVGEISDAVRSDLGYHIIQVLEHADHRPVTLELWPAVQQHAFEQWLAEQRAQAQIERLITP